jgi:Fusaric acid resistance protein family
MTRSGWEDLVVAASPHRIEIQRDMAARMLDRLMQLLPRLGSTDDPRQSSIESFRDMRAGLDTLDLQVEREKPEPSLQTSIESVLVGTRHHFQRCVERGSRQTPAVGQLRRIDTALEQTALAAVGGAPLEAMRALASLRLAVFPDMPPPTTFGKGPSMEAPT